MHDVTAERQRLHSEFRNDLLKRQLSNSENFDRSLLALASGLLAASMAFIRPTPVVGGGTQHAAILAWSWVALGSSIGSTMLSFLISQLAIDRQLDFAEQYYLKSVEGALSAPNRAAAWTVRLNWCAALAFGVGVGLTVWFSILSIQTR